MAGGALDEIEARFVASGEDVRDAGAGDADGVRELRLADVFGREKLLKVRNVGVTTLGEFDAEFDRIGLWNQWKFNRPINV